MWLFGRRVVAHKELVLHGGEEGLFVRKAELESQHYFVVNFKRHPHAPGLTLLQHVNILRDMLKFLLICSEFF